MEICLVHGNPPLRKLRRLQAKGITLVALDMEADGCLSDAALPHKNRLSYALPDSNKRAVDWLNEWSAKPLQNRKNIKELLMLDGFSFWWCMEQWLFYSFVYRNSLSQVVDAVDAVRSILQVEQPRVLWHIDDGTLYSKVIPHVARGIQQHKIRHARPIVRRSWESIRPLAIREFLRWNRRARQLYWAMAARARESSQKGKILALCSYRWTRVEHPIVHAPTLGDPYVTPIIAQLSCAATYVDATNRDYLGFAALHNKSRSQGSHALLEQYFSRADAVWVHKSLRHLQETACALERSGAFRASWTYHGVDLWPLIAPQFRAYFDYRLEAHLVDFACVKSLLENERPSVVIYPSEGGDLAFVFFHLCKNKKISCVGLQHGTLSYSPLTVHKKEETRGPAAVPRPTKLLLYGPYYRSFLARHAHYPRDETVIVGNLRYDHFNHHPSRQALAKKLCLDLNKPVLMYAGNVLPSEEEYFAMTREVFETAKALGLQLIVKQHPGEQGDTVYRRLADKTDIKPVIIKHASTLELLMIADVVVGYESTLDYEAMILGKPVIVMNFGGRPFTLPFAEKKAALAVRCAEEVLPTVRQAMWNSKTRTTLARRARSLVSAHCYKVDGKSAARAAKVVRELLQ